LPQDADEALREGLRQIVPQFSRRKWQKGRQCWYTDTPQGDFVVDTHPSIDGLFIATGGSGHAFKFLPILGRYIADCFEGTATEEVSTKWKFPNGRRYPNDVIVCDDGSRRGPK
ncbi:hypothetical protein A1O1_06680, partial [Capronia coronata CBS 617.96]